MKQYRTGIDVGSTTVKLVVLDENSDLLYSDYRRHQAKTQATLLAMLAKAAEAIGNCMLSVSLTGSGAVALAKALDLPFTQEVVAVADALSHLAPEAEVAIELGGEDAKLLFLRPTLEARMNGVCAGGTGAFIDSVHVRSSGPLPRREERKIASAWFPVMKTSMLPVIPGTTGSISNKSRQLSAERD